MLSSLASYLLGSHSSEQAAVAADVRIRTTNTDDDDDWVLIDAAGPEALTVLSRTSSASSLPVEDSWFVTPPPCFTGAGPVHVETSPLEDLLIEHPSMSVYQQQQQRPSLLPLPVSSSDGGYLQQPAGPAAQEVVVVVVEEAANPVAPRPQQTAQLYSLQQQQALHARSAQKLQQRRAYQSLKGKHLERHNKSREVNSRNRQLRRADHMLHHSGANNNRKC